MPHPLQLVMRSPEPVLLIGDSSQGRFPGMSYHCYTRVGKAFHCLDLGRLKRSRGLTRGGRVYRSVAELPPDRGSLAILWMLPRTAIRGVEAAHEAGCSRVWFNFHTGHREAVERARALGMEVVEIGRCPVCYLDEMVPICRAHTAAMKLAGSWRLPPQTDPAARRREVI